MCYKPTNITVKESRSFFSTEAMAPLGTLKLNWFWVSLLGLPHYQRKNKKEQMCNISLQWDFRHGVVVLASVSRACLYDPGDYAFWWLESGLRVLKFTSHKRFWVLSILSMTNPNFRQRPPSKTILPLLNSDDPTNLGLLFGFRFWSEFLRLITNQSHRQPCRPLYSFATMPSRSRRGPFLCQVQSSALKIGHTIYARLCPRSYKLVYNPL